MTGSIAYKTLEDALASARPPLLIDVRRRNASEGASEMACGALRRDPESVLEWAPTLPRARTVVVYCVHGHEVSQEAARTLCDAGMDAWHLEGGIEEGWKANGGTLDVKPANAATRW